MSADPLQALAPGTPFTLQAPGKPARRYVIARDGTFASLEPDVGYTNRAIFKDINMAEHGDDMLRGVAGRDQPGGGLWPVATGIEGTRALIGLLCANYGVKLTLGWEKKPDLAAWCASFKAVRAKKPAPEKPEPIKPAFAVGQLWRGREGHEMVITRTLQDALHVRIVQQPNGGFQYPVLEWKLRTDGTYTGDPQCPGTLDLVEYLGGRQENP